MKKKVIISVLTGFCIAISLMGTFRRTEEALSGAVVRLHVRANSDSAEDQSLKLKVRDRILKESGKLLAGVQNKSEAHIIIGRNLDHLRQCAQDEVLICGYDYPVEISFGKSDFPTKTYGDVCLPAGTYEALIVNIGNAKGHNWWCVMFPPLCFTEESGEELTADTEEIFKENMDKGTYDMISEGKPKIKFKLYEWWKKISVK